MRRPIVGAARMPSVSLGAMGLFKKLTDPTPGGGLTGDDPDAVRRRRDARDAVHLPDRKDVATPAARVVDPTEVIMGGIAARGRIDSIRPAAREINLQPTFEVRLTVLGAEDQFTAHVIQPVAEEYASVAVADAEVVVKYSADDHGAVWIDWAASAAA